MNQVYLMQSDDSGYYKIGVSKNPKRRVAQLQTGNAEKIRLIESFASKIAYKIEMALQNQYMPSKINGEWFKLSIENEIDFINQCKKIESNILLLMENDSFFE